MTNIEQVRKAYAQLPFYTNNMADVAARVDADLTKDEDLVAVYELVLDEKFGNFPNVRLANDRLVQGL